MWEAPKGYLLYAVTLNRWGGYDVLMDEALHEARCSSPNQTLPSGTLSGENDEGREGRNSEQWTGGSDEN